LKQSEKVSLLRTIVHPFGCPTFQWSKKLGSN